MQLLPVATDSNLSSFSRYQVVKNSFMHYIEMGSGDPILFLHGMPTSSFLWRNVMPMLTSHGRCIAPDLIGMGKSGKPQIKYDIYQQIEFVEAFINSLQLKNITLVMHEWGSVIGFDYAMRFPKNIKSLIFYESYPKLIKDISHMSIPMQQLSQLLKDKKNAEKAILLDNYLVNRLLPRGALQGFSERTLAHYRRPFLTKQSRQVLLQYANELPLGNVKTQAAKLIKQYSKKLTKSDIPKLMLYAVPGFMTTIESLQWCRNNFPNLDIVDISEAMHFAQESKPERFAAAIDEWLELL